MADDDKANILLVDDQPSNLLALEAVLGDLGQNLVRARSGEEALRQLLGQEFAVVLMDVQMPGLDGFETARLIRSRDKTRHLPIIFLTAVHRTDQEIGKGYSLGAVDYIFKPVVPEVLRSKVSVFVELYQKTEQVKQQARLLQKTQQREHERRLQEERHGWEVDRLRAEAAQERKIAEQLAEADRRKDEFLALLAHELRNPLSPILNALQIIALQGKANPEVEQARAMAERQVRHLSRLVDDLLDVARITHGKIHLRKEAVELGPLVARVVENHRPLFDSFRHELTAQLPPGPVVIEADPMRVEQVVANLLNNAAKYTEPGGHIRVALERDGDAAVLRVRDDGMGIAADQLGAIFELFTQAGRSLDSSSQWGLGLGLGLVRKLVELHGGSVQASSPGLGQGSEFVVRLPLRKEEGGRRKEEKDGACVHPSSFCLPPCKRRVLVVDDNRDAAQSLALLLGLHGHEVYLAHDGQEALKEARAHHPDLILMDIGLPRLDGYEVARQLRAKDDTRRAVLVAMTGYGQEEDRRRSREAGFVRHLVKPVDIKEIQEILTAKG